MDVSRKQMARTAGLDLKEEARPELTALRDICKRVAGEAMGVDGPPKGEKGKSIRHSA